MKTLTNPTENPPDAADAPILLHVTEAAALLRLSRSQVYNMILAGELPHVRFGRAVRVPCKPLMDYIARLTVDTDSAA